MKHGVPARHSVCTKDQARAIIETKDRFIIADCWCRGERDRCVRSPVDVCLHFAEHGSINPSGRREVGREEALELVEEARQRALVSRPFSVAGGRGIDGICFCCDDCCAFLTGRDPDPCDRGTLIERTIEGCCSSCGICETVCRFGARLMDAGRLVVTRHECWGCGLCADACTNRCIEMVPRGPAVEAP